jgi:hypothetical protein
VAVVGVSTEWADLIDPMVPVILDLVIASWERMTQPSTDEKEDIITEALCRTLRAAREARELPFQIHIQFVELDSAIDEDLGRLDIAFFPLINREDIYFCLECKRLNVVKDGKRRAYASEYVTFGMSRFVTGQYSRAVRHGGMMGYVLDGDVSRAMSNVEASIRTHHAALSMDPPGDLFPSTVLTTDARARETKHHRINEADPFHVHHLFMEAKLT